MKDEIARSIVLSGVVCVRKMLLNNIRRKKIIWIVGG